MKHKGSHLSPRLIALLNHFEESLSERLGKIKPKDKEDVLSLSWMRFMIEQLALTHADIKTLITELELPISDWDDKWIDVYLDNSVKLLDICIAFSSELSRLNHSHLYLQCALQKLNPLSPPQFVQAASSLDGWKKHIGSKNPRIVNSFSFIDSLTMTLNLPKVKNSPKGKVLMQALYGVRVMTVFICSIFAATFSGSVEKLAKIQVLETCLWAESFGDVEGFLHSEIRNIFSDGSVTALKELEAVDTSVKKLYPIITNHGEVEELSRCISDLGEKAENLSKGVDLLMKQVDGFFQIVFSGRDALLSNIRLGGDNVLGSKPETNKLGQVVR